MRGVRIVEAGALGVEAAVVSVGAYRGCYNNVITGYPSPPGCWGGRVKRWHRGVRSAVAAKGIGDSQTILAGYVITML
jgi:sugar phosphate isomerase/epimerase